MARRSLRDRAVRRWSLLMLASIFTVFSSGRAAGAPGELDPTLGTGGILTSTVVTDQARLAIQPDGKFIAVGRGDGGAVVRVARFNPDGSLDTTFDGDGWTSIDATPGQLDLATDVMVQSDGKIVVAGQSWASGNYDSMLIRLMPDGSLDASFSGDGIAIFQLDAATDSFQAVAIQPDGHIVGGGSVGSGASAKWSFVRVEPDGDLDVTFDGDGTRLIANTGARIFSLVIEPDGQILGAGLAGAGATDIALIRLDPDGSLDAGFDGDGILIDDVSAGGPDLAFRLALQSDGRILVAGEVGNVFTTLRYNTDGSRDSSFSVDGFDSQNFSGVFSRATGIISVPDGRILVGGYRVEATGVMDFALAAYNSDGTLDPTFGNAGLVKLDSLEATFSGNLVSAPDGNVILAGLSAFGIRVAKFQVGGGAGPAPAPVPEAPVTYELRVKKVGQGSVLGDPVLDIDCGSDCSTRLGPQVVGSLAATPHDGWLFDGWTGDCASVQGATCTVAMSTDRSVTATFSKVPPPPPEPDIVQTGRCKGHEVGTFLELPDGGALIVGTRGADDIVGTSGQDVICGLEGADSLYGGAKPDILAGGAGPDHLYGNRGRDKLEGGEGPDWCEVAPGYDHTDSCEVVYRR